MKLSLKIFLGIFISSMISVISISYLLIERYSNSVLNFETINSYREYESFFNTLYFNADEENIKENLEKISKNNKKLIFSYYINDKLLYTNSDIELSDKNILNVKDEYYNSMVEKNKGKHYLLIAKEIGNNTKLIIYKNIDSVYKNINKLTVLCIYVSIGLLFLLLFIAYFVSKTITKPLSRINNDVKKVASGDYDINLEEGKDEVGNLAKNINIMSKEIKNRNNELLQSIENKQLFIDNLSHEMNTPLTSIYGYIELMEKTELDGEKKYKALEYMKGETKRIMDMQKKLLMLSYKENTSIDKKRLDLNNIFNNLNIELEPKYKDKNIKLEFNNNIDIFNGDELLVSLAVSNLIRNAINNSDSNTTIKVNTYNEGGYNYIAVTDEGCGIKEEDIKKIIEPFYRVDKARSRKDGGAGLGLSIVKKIMNIHNGELIIESTINVGSTFILKFPL